MVTPKKNWSKEKKLLATLKYSLTLDLWTSLAKHYNQIKNLISYFHHSHTAAAQIRDIQQKTTKKMNFRM
jgi:hypothetical protein